MHAWPVHTTKVVAVHEGNACVVQSVRDCISKGVSFMLPIVDYYLLFKELYNTIIKFKGMFACYRCLVAPYNHLYVVTTLHI